MEKSIWKEITHNLIPNISFNLSTFGKSQQECLEIDIKYLLIVAHKFKSEPTIELNWLENLSAYVLNNEIIFTYFIRSWTTQNTIIMRVRLPFKKANLVKIPSVTSVWLMANLFEEEISDLMGVVFYNNENVKTVNSIKRSTLPDTITGYPLLK